METIKLQFDKNDRDYMIGTIARISKKYDGIWNPIFDEFYFESMRQLKKFRNEIKKFKVWWTINK